MHGHKNPRSKSIRRLAGKLSAYAAAAAPLSASEAGAAIIHTDLSAQPISIANGSFDLDLNLDGTVDFVFLQQRVRSSYSSTYGCSSIWRRDRQESLLRGQGENSVLGEPTQGAFKLPAQVSISPHAPGIKNALLAQYGFFFSTSCSDSGTSGTYSAGQFATYDLNPVRGYVGLQFEVAGSGRHAAWADIEASAHELILHAFAYETTANQSIVAGAVPEPPSLALLAAGAAGLAMLRRRRGCPKTS